ncbi:MAG: DNA polymerase III subunit beta [Clostridia bacterium]|nr:DNA polymerase III subunit beta [Clostridia bacterium]MBQ6171219.1 DNA polymerase III subunit beta [Clostridia bacterium]
MNFSCDRTMLYETFSIVSRSIPAKNALPVLSCFLINASEDGNITVSGFDMDLGITTTVTGEVSVPGTVAVDAKMLLDIIRSMGPDFINFAENDNKTITVKGGKTEYILPVMDPETFPERPSAIGCEYITVDQKMLHSVIRQTVFAVSQSDVKGVYTGAFFNIHDGILEAVCTDSFRFAMRKEKYACDRDISFLCQGRVLNELIKIMKNDDGEVKIGLTGRHIVFEFDDTVMISRLVDGAYLNYSTLIPKSFKYTVKIKTEEMKKAIERASVLINEKMKAPVRISLETNRIFITCKTPDGHSFDDEIITETNGGPLEIGVNNRNLLTVLSACESEEVLMNFNSALSPIGFMPVEGDSFMFLIAPMRLNTK